VRISLDWIGSLLGIEALPVDAGELVPLLSRRVAEIDALERTAASIPGVVVGEVLDCAPHPDADRLLRLQVDLGALGRRQICAGIRAFYDVQALVGRQIVVVANLEPA